MTATLLAELERRGVRLQANGESLSIDAPKGVLTDDLLSQLRAHKTELLDLLRPRPSRPTLPCFACHGVDYWQRTDGTWLCSRCHPDPSAIAAPSPLHPLGVQILEMAKAQGWPVVSLTKWEKIPGGEQTWWLFVNVFDEVKFNAALEGLRLMEAFDGS